MIGKIVSIMTVTGELIGTLEEKRPDSYLIKSPRIISGVPGGEIAFQQSITLTGKICPDRIEINRRHVVYMLEAEEQFAEYYRTQMPGIQL